MLGFLHWAFKDCYKNVQFYAFLTVLFSIVMQFGGCPDPWPFRVMLTGVFASLIDTAVMLINVQYQAYKFEKKQIAQELSRK